MGEWFSSRYHAATEIMARRAQTPSHTETEISGNQPSELGKQIHGEWDKYENKEI